MGTACSVPAGRQAPGPEGDVGAPTYGKYFKSLLIFRQVKSFAPSGVPEDRVPAPLLPAGIGHKVRDVPNHIEAGSREAFAVAVVFSLLLAGCAHGPISLVSLDGSQTSDLSRVSVIMEDENHPVLLRGLDGVPFKSMRVPGPLGKYAYVMSAGNHVFWVKGAPYPHPLMPQRIRCYTLHVELAPGGRYLLKEEDDGNRALLLRADTGDVGAIGQLVDEPWIFLRDCKWEQAQDLTNKD